MSDPRPLPTVRWGAHEITRLLVGHNPVKGTSHYSRALDAEMKEWHAGLVREILTAAAT